MTKTDKSIRNVCIAAIKRHTIRPYDFVATEFYDQDLPSIHLDLILSQMNLIDEELPIASTYLNGNWTLVTTQRIVTSSGKGLQEIAISEIGGMDFSPFKDKTINIIRGAILGKNQKQIDCLIETGRASMVIIYAIRSNPLLRA